MKTMLALAAFALAPAAHAAPPPGYDVESAFKEADTNKDGSVEIDEFYDRLVESYFHADSDKNGTLSKEEFVRAVVIEEDFAAADGNGDGVLSRQEFVRSRLPLFTSSDTDKDGALSLAEVKAALEKGGAR
jgi:Ca2+-binding EF-hand superfamily protein